MCVCVYSCLALIIIIHFPRDVHLAYDILLSLSGSEEGDEQTA